MTSILTNSKSRLQTARYGSSRIFHKLCSVKCWHAPPMRKTRLASNTRRCSTRRRDWTVRRLRLNEQVKRNAVRFAVDFFSMLAGPSATRWLQIATTSSGSNFPRRCHSPSPSADGGFRPEHSARGVSLYVVRAFVELREAIATHKELAYPTFTGTSVIVSFPNMSMTFTATV